jgi:mycothiol system anti-sigma-R factor
MADIIYRCQDIEPVLYLYIDNEIEDPIQTHAIEFHFNECPPCFSHFELERSYFLHIKQILSSSCQEEAPAELRDAIINSINAMAAGAVITQSFFSSVHFQQTSSIDGVTESSTMRVQFSTEMSSFTFEAINPLETANPDESKNSYESSNPYESSNQDSYDNGEGRKTS